MKSISHPADILYLHIPQPREAKTPETKKAELLKNEEGGLRRPQRAIEIRRGSPSTFDG